MFAQPQSNTDKPLLVTPIATDEPRQRVHISSDDRGGLKIGQQAMVTIAQNYWFNYSQMFLNLAVVKAYFQIRLLPLSIIWQSCSYTHAAIHIYYVDLLVTLPLMLFHYGFSETKKECG